MIKKSLMVLMLLGFAVAASAQMFGPAATVNGVEIPRSKLQSQVNHLINQRGMGSGGITQPGTFKGFQDEVLQQLIVQELLWQEAQRRSFVVSDEDVEQQLQKMKSGFDNEQAFLFKIKEGGFTEDTFRQDIREQRSAQRMVREGIEPNITITDEDIESKKYRLDTNFRRNVINKKISLVPKTGKGSFNVTVPVPFDGMEAEKKVTQMSIKF